MKLNGRYGAKTPITDDDRYAHEAMMHLGRRTIWWTNLFPPNKNLVIIWQWKRREIDPPVEEAFFAYEYDYNPLLWIAYDNRYPLYNGQSLAMAGLE